MRVRKMKTNGGTRTLMTGFIVARLVLVCSLCALAAGCLGCMDYNRGQNRHNLNFPLNGSGPYEPVEFSLCDDDNARWQTPRRSICMADNLSDDVFPVCGSNQDCLESEECVCGGCKPLTCTSSSGFFTCGLEKCVDQHCLRPCEPARSDCPDGSYCSPVWTVCRPQCASDADCPAGEVCETESDENEAGERIEVSICVAKFCNSDASCGAGRRCLPLYNGRNASSPALIAQADAFQLFFEERDGAASVIHRALSTDGLNWRIDQEEVLAPQQAWENTAVAHPALLDRGEDLYLYYEGGDGAGIGVALSHSGGPFSRPDPLGDLPLLAPQLAWEDGRIGEPTAALIDGLLHLYYTGGTEDGIGLATGGDPLSISDRRQQPVAAPTSMGTRQPELGYCRTDAHCLEGLICHHPNPREDGGLCAPNSCEGCPEPLICEESQCVCPDKECLADNLPFWIDVERLGGTSVLYEPLGEGDPVAKLFLHGWGRSSGLQRRADYSLAFLLPDEQGLYSGYPFNPIVDLVYLTSHGDETDPAILKIGKTYLLYYTIGSGGSAKLGVSRHPVVPLLPDDN